MTEHGSSAGGNQIDHVGRPCGRGHLARTAPRSLIDFRFRWSSMAMGQRHSIISGSGPPAGPSQPSVGAPGASPRAGSEQPRATRPPGRPWAPSAHLLSGVEGPGRRLGGSPDENVPHGVTRSSTSEGDQTVHVAPVTGRPGLRGRSRPAAKPRDRWSCLAHFGTAASWRTRGATNRAVPSPSSHPRPRSWA